MATITSAAAGGNWSSASTWTGGVVPGSADMVVFGSTTADVTINSSVNCASLTGSAATANYGFRVAAGGVLIVGGSINAGAYLANCYGVRLDGGAIFAQTVCGMSSVNGSGVLVVGSGTLRANAIGGTGNNACGVIVQFATAGSTFTMTGNCTGSTGTNSQGLYISHQGSSGTVTINGNANASAANYGINHYGANSGVVLTINGEVNSYGSMPGVLGWNVPEKLLLLGPPIIQLGPYSVLEGAAGSTALPLKQVVPGNGGADGINLGQDIRAVVSTTFPGASVAVENSYSVRLNFPALAAGTYLIPITATNLHGSNTTTIPFTVLADPNPRAREGVGCGRIVDIWAALGKPAVLGIACVGGTGSLQITAPRIPDGTLLPGVGNLTTSGEAAALAVRVSPSGALGTVFSATAAFANGVWTISDLRATASFLKWSWGAARKLARRQAASIARTTWDSGTSLAYRAGAGTLACVPCLTTTGGTAVIQADEFLEADFVAEDWSLTSQDAALDVSTASLATSIPAGTRWVIFSTASTIAITG